jgi:hypothetical protein
VNTFYTLDTQLEEVARAMLLTLTTALPQALTDVAAVMADEDAVYYAALGEPVPDTPLPPPAKWFEGHHPSILERPVDEFPNVTCMAYNHRSANDLAADQYEPFAYPVYVEAAVMHTDESTINRVAWRYAKALHRAVLYNDTLRTALPQVGADDSVVIQRASQSPDVAISNAAARRVSEFTDDVVFVQLVRLDTSYRLIQPW